MSTVRIGGLASTYKVAMCPMYAAGGEAACGDGPFCRFAHGAGDVRTQAQNEADGIVSEMGLHKYLNTLEQARLAAAATRVESDHPVTVAASTRLQEGPHRDPIEPVITFNERDSPSANDSLTDVPNDQEEDVVFRLLSALDEPGMADEYDRDEEERLISEARAALRNELVVQMTACGIQLPTHMGTDMM